MHIADVHLGAEPDAGKKYSPQRKQEIWDSFTKVVDLCEKERMDLLLIAGDLFHRQPLMRELKEINYLFSRLSHTKVVLIAGNHDHIKKDSYYATFSWADNVYPLFDEEMQCAQIPEYDLGVYGFSYHRKEIRKPLYDSAAAPGRFRYEILLAHGGDESHIPVKKERLENLGYDYVALGHLHKPQTVGQRAAYAGALEPIDKNDTGRHGYIKGTLDERGLRIRFVQHAKREYIHGKLEVTKAMTNTSLREKLRKFIEKNGMENLYKFVLTGFRDADMVLFLDSMDVYGNILEIRDETKPFYDLEQLAVRNRDNLLGRYIESFSMSEEDSVEQMALYDGVQALMETKRG